MMIDTQILSYAYKGRGIAVSSARISSVAAHEFLEVYDPNSTTRFRYYIKYQAGRHFGAPSISPANWKGGAVQRLVLDFGADYPQLIEFNSRATAAIINDRNVPAFGHILSSLEKPLQKKLRPRFAYLCEHIRECVPLVPQTAEIGIQLLWDFVQHNNVKANFRNSVNDMMILATAISGGENLLTDDSLLARFAAAQQHAPLREVGDGLIAIDFERKEGVRKRLSSESKGYINRGWRIAVDTQRRALP
ncbi:hypothetical protein PARHAE_02922 [Paracoccus haematequi]|uniref:Uncharacterized protein n=1 Tax=Paracoccus haematequi TaxID=2491866 RepID=A0A3S4CKP9_9RHOB|nr:hypothetical protein [Paracoccus haematequi]VDS09715.1 hypothetical protein PARHAE_02922 [Paracoccus haematequi]